MSLAHSAKECGKAKGTAAAAGDGRKEEKFQEGRKAKRQGVGRWLFGRQGLECFFLLSSLLPFPDFFLLSAVAPAAAVPLSFLDIVPALGRLFL